MTQWRASSWLDQCRRSWIRTVATRPLSPRTQTGPSTSTCLCCSKRTSPWTDSRRRWQTWARQRERRWWRWKWSLQRPVKRSRSSWVKRCAKRHVEVAKYAACAGSSGRLYQTTPSCCRLSKSKRWRSLASSNFHEGRSRFPWKSRERLAWKGTQA